MESLLTVEVLDDKSASNLVSQKISQKATLPIY